MRLGLAGLVPLDAYISCLQLLVDWRHRLPGMSLRGLLNVLPGLRAQAGCPDISPVPRGIRKTKE